MTASASFALVVASPASSVAEAMVEAQKLRLLYLRLLLAEEELGRLLSKCIFACLTIIVGLICDGLELAFLLSSPLLIALRPFRHESII